MTYRVRNALSLLFRGPYEFVTTVYPPSDCRVEYVALWTGKDIPAGMPMSPKLSLLGLNMRFLDVFLFSWVKWTRSPVGIFLLFESLMTTWRLPLIRPDGYKDWS